MADMILELKGEYFKRQYLLYIIEIIHKKHKIYYIGQTGDHNYLTARPAFRRLAGHLEDVGGSTQNQIYRHLAVKELDFSIAAKNDSSFIEEIKQAVEKYLVESTVRMYVYILQDFNPEISREKHLEIVRKVTLLEKFVIALFESQKKIIANKKLTRPPKNSKCPFTDIFQQIITDFGLFQGKK